ncbi:MAG: YcfL family protein [Planctomycetota bacterium]|jgi:uncharacterized protein YcfL|nr:YcfL family protein [Planctomycetota bacterium]
MKTLSSLLPLALVALVGCTAAPRGSVNSFDGKNTEVGNALLNASLEIRNIVRAEKNGLKVAQFELHNRHSTALAFQWTVEWYDRSGLKIQYGPAHWEPERLAGSASKTLQIVAPSPDADSWKLQVGSRDEVQ